MQNKPIEEIYELSPMQQGMLFYTLYDPDSDVYFEQLICTLQGALDVSVLQQAWQQVVQRHAVLRSSFHWEELNEPLQVVHRQVELPWVRYDWRELAPTEQQHQLDFLLETDRSQPFDLGQAPLMRFTLIQVSDQIHDLVWSHHHLLFDGWSMPTILEEVLTYHEALHRGEMLHLSAPCLYRDYIAWLKAQDRAQAKAFWHGALEGIVAPAPLPTPFKGEQRLGADEFTKASYAEQPFTCSIAVSEQLRALARQHHLTLNNVVQGAWALLLARYSGETEVIFGATVSGRPADLPGVESMVGLFINTLPVRTHASGDAELIPWLKGLQAQQIEQEPYAYLPLAEIQQMSDVPTGLPLFESLLVFENYPFDASRYNRDGSIDISHLRSIERTNYPLTVIVNPQAELSGRFIYDTRRFETSAIRRLSSHFETLLASIAAAPGQQLAEVSLLTAAERAQILVEWNNTQAAYPFDQCIHQLFEAQAARTPDAVAVVFDDQQLTYRELNERANQLAHHMQALEVAAEVLVGLYVERSLEMVVGLLGILKAGGAYVPLDPTYPQERLAFMLEDAQITVLLTQANLQADLSPTLTTFCLDTQWANLRHKSPANPSCAVTSNNMAYVLYTSGSTGQPKGVVIEHRNAVAFLSWAQTVFTPEELEGVFASTSICFDLSVFEIFLPLSCGKTVIVAENALALPTLPVNPPITLINTVPSAMHELVRMNGVPESVQVVNLAGEPLPNALVQAIYAQENIRKVYNLYGPSEDTTYSTFVLTEKGATQNPAIGRPIANTQVYLLDQALQPVPVGVPGELCLGGAGLARGYLNRPELTEAKFIPHIFGEQASARLYKTGDLARYLPDGTLEFLGRIDTQVKLRGFRIELGEIEAVLSQHPDVQEAIAIVCEDTPGHKTLVAYVIPRQEPPIPSDLRDFLKTKLPDYMIPTFFVPLETLPITPNGKVDRQALPQPYASQRELEVSFVPPRTATEETLAAIWSDVLGVEKISIRDNFFELGGHSLLATQVLSRLQEAFFIQLPLRQLFDRPTIADLAEVVVAQQLEQAESDALEQILGEVETLSDDDVKQQLRS